MQKPSIIYMGTPDFAVVPLKAILENGFNVKAVVTVADKPSGRGQKVRMSPVKTYALEKGIEVLQPLKLKSEEFLEDLKRIDADLFVVIAFRMLPKEVWQLPKLGTFNIHGSLLPNYRGAAPINWAIINGETISGVTSFFINEEIDSGSLIDTIEVAIGENDNAGSMHDKLMDAAAELSVKTITQIAEGKVTPKKQELSGLEKPAPKIFKDDCEIDWKNNPKDIYNFIRGLSPYPVSWSSIYQDGNKIGQLRIFKALLVDEQTDLKAGKVWFDKSRMIISLAGQSVEILELQWPGKKKMDVKSFLNGFRLSENISVLG